MLPPTFTPALLRQLELLRLRSRRAFLGSRQGGHLSPKKGHGLEFSDYRQYELGDNPRHIDWGVYGRTDRLYVKRYQEEQDLRVLLVLDASPSMRPPGGEAKWELARDITMALAYIGLMEQDSVIVAALGAGASPTFTGPRAVHVVGEFIGKLNPINVAADEHFFSREVRRAGARIKFPGVAVVISDFLMSLNEIESAFRALRSKNLDITAVQVLADEVEPRVFQNELVAVDVETKERISISLAGSMREQYVQAFNAHQESLRGFFADTGVRFIETTADSDLARVMSEGLAQSGLLQ